MLKKKKMAQGYSLEDPESLLKRAKMIYPKGTEYTCPQDNTIQEVCGQFTVYSEYDGHEEDSITDGCGGFVYFDGKWAKIIEQ